MERKILIRFDDICPTMDYEQFERANDVLRKYHVKPLLGVIPQCKDPDLMIEEAHEDFWDYIKSLQKDGYTLAMHGYEHIFDSESRGLVNSGYKSEFAGHSYVVQFEKIRRGKLCLESNGIETDIFFAPAHSYDKNTIKALADNGFRYMSDGKCVKVVLRNGVKCLPCRSGGVPKIKRKGYYTAVFHAHEWVRTDKAEEFEKLTQLCSEYQKDIVDFEEYSQQQVGNIYVQLAIEKIYVTYERYFRPILSKIKYLLLKFKG